MAGIRALISDFGGVLTTPLIGSFAAFQDAAGSRPRRSAGRCRRSPTAMAPIPCSSSRRGRLTEAEFLTGSRRQLEPELGHVPEMHRFNEIYFEALRAERADDRADARDQGDGDTGWRC